MRKRLPLSHHTVLEGEDVLGKRGHILFTRSEFVALLIAMFIGIPLFIPVIAINMLLDQLSLASLRPKLITNLVCIIGLIAWWAVICKFFGHLPLLIMIGLLAFAWALVEFRSWW